MMLLKMFNLLVLRGMETEIPVCAPRHEAELLAMIHGSDGVKLTSQEPAGVLPFGSVQDERERLRLKYGLKAEDVYWVDTLYPSDMGLGEAMRQGEAEAPEDVPADPEAPETPKSGKPRGRKAQAKADPEAPEAEQPAQDGGDAPAV